MNIVVLQPPYPSEGTAADTEICLDWMREQLAQLEPGGQDLVLLPEYANAPGLNERDALRKFAEDQGAAFVREAGETAGRLECLIALGAVIRSGERWFNRTLVFDKTGELGFAYDKVHLTEAERQADGRISNLAFSISNLAYSDGEEETGAEKGSLDAITGLTGYKN